MGRHRTYTRDDVLDRAMMLFWRRGFEGASLADLVAATGLNRFSLYKEFGGKEGLFAAALDRFLGYRMAEYAASLGQAPAGFASIRAYFAGLDYGDDYLGCFMFNTLTQKDAVPDAAFAAALAAMRRAEGLFRANLEASVAAGEIDAGADLATMARLLMALDQGLHSYGTAAATVAEKDAVATLALDGLLRRTVSDRAPA